MPLKKILILISLPLIVAMYSACYYDKADLLYPNSSFTECDTITVSYIQRVVPLLSQQCYGCHTASSPGGGVVLGTYAADKVYADNGKLVGVINQFTGFQPMPKGANKMTVCQIAKIRKWVDGGAPNN